MSNTIISAPIRFKPLFRPYIWGGRRLETSLHKPIPAEGIWAESWEIVDHGADQSHVESDSPSGKPNIGQTLRHLIETSPESILGKGASPTSQFPLLLKYLDCQRVLSIQVHPNDAYSAKMIPPDLGKTEAWYVMEASEEAVIYAGLKTGVQSQDLAQAIQAGNIESCLYSFHPSSGDCIFIPAGTVHALGAGLIVAEIQQASDTTFRLYDWNRLGADGAPRPLHIDQALEVIDFNRGPVSPVVPTVTADSGRMNLVTCDRFVLDKIQSDLKGFSLDDQFAIATVVQGIVSIRGSQQATQSDPPACQLSIGQSVLLPAAMGSVDFMVAADSILLLARPPRFAS